MLLMGIFFLLEDFKVTVNNLHVRNLCEGEGDLMKVFKRA